MRKHFFLPVIFLCLALWPHTSARACAWGSTEIYHFSMFDYFLLKQCTPNKYFYYNRHIAACKGFPHKPNPNFDFDTYYEPEAPKQDLNLVAWKTLLATDAAETTIGDLVYRTGLDTLVLLQRKMAGENVTLPEALTENAFASQILSQKRTDIIEYLVFAKQCELFALLEWEWVGWQEEDGTPKTRQVSDEAEAAMRSLKAELMPLLEQQSNPLLKQRYLYQTVRLAYFLQDFSEVIRLCDTYATAEMPANYIDSRLRGRKAGAYFRLGQINEAAYNYALVYQHYKDSDIAFAERSYFNFRILMANYGAQSKANLQGCLALAKTADEKATLWFLHGLVRSYEESGYFEKVSSESEVNAHTRMLNTLEQLWTNQPKGDALETWLWRSIHDIENVALRPSFYSPTHADTAAYKPAQHDIVLTSFGGEAKESSVWDSLMRAISDFFSSFFGFFSSDSSSTVAQSDSTATEEYESPYYGSNFYVANSFEIAGFHSPEERQKTLTYLADYRKIIAKIAAANNTQQPALWHLTNAYLLVMEKSYPQAMAALQQARKSYSKDQSAYIPKQADLLEQYILLEQQPRIETAYEAKLLKFAEAQEDTTYHFNYLFYNKLAQKYLAQNEFNKAVMAYQKAKSKNAVAVLLDMYASDAQLEQLKEYVGSSNGNDWEQFLKKDFLTEDQLLEAKAVRLARENHFAEALDLLKYLPQSHWKKSETFWATLGNKFEPADYRAYNYLQFFTTIDSLQKLANSDKENTANHLMKIGNALWSSPYWGYNNQLWSGDLITAARNFTGIEYPLNVSDTLSTQLYVKKRRFMNRYGTSLLAGKYYKRVTELNPDQLGTQACYLGMSLAMRTQTTFHDDTYVNDYQTFLAQWKKQFVHTNTGLQILEECPNLKKMYKSEEKAI